MSFTKCCSPDVGFGSSLTLSNPITDPVDVPFRFRDLPKELRFMVYEYALSFDSIDKYCSDYLELLCVTSDTREPAPDVEKSCPSILLVSKDITEEALPILYKTPLNLSFGIFKAHLQDLIAPELLRKLRYINFSDAGTRHLNPPPHDCFGGICYAVTELATILRSGHSIKSFTMDYTSAYLSFHLRDCLDDEQKQCGIKSWAHNLIRALKELHSIEMVSLTVELSEDIKQEIVSCMKGPACGFLSLPLHIRQKIYGYAADVNDGASAFQLAIKQLALASITTILSPANIKLTHISNQDPTFKETTTPTIFLLNRQIEQEANEVIYSKPFVIKNLYPMVNSTFLKLDDFFTPYTFKKIQHLELHLTYHNHLSMLPTVANMLRRRRKNNLLKSLHLHFSEPRSKRLILAISEYYPDNTVYACMRYLNYLRGAVGKVTITGSMPECFTAPIIHNMGLKDLSEKAMPIKVRDVHEREVDVHAVQGTAFYRKQRGILIEPVEVMEID
ncbi:unnamed protein product [Aureobasidium vineae]|uniref:F-box domain-containing protein n=1 Tax=Aureobasidium vineae TaxID=2773715 RepID=A0A9N8J7R7_9PEZI|nr:unnamed protein product [Aureobasidium vineae]